MTTTSPDKDAEATHAPAHAFSWDRPWGLTLCLLGTSLVVFAVLFREPLYDAIWLWSNRSTYNHCFLILPISLYLLWEERHDFLKTTPKPSIIGLGMIILFLLIWLFAASANILEGEHIALVGILQGLLLTLLGWDIYKRHWLAFTYLWLLVPTGTFLIPVLRDLATIQTMWWLELAQIPVFQDGYHLQTPTGNYLIAAGCAGLNFVLTAIALTPVYGMLIYRSWTKRFMAAGAMLAVAIIANAIRIFLIIALAEFSNKRIDIVDDHILYGWGFFAVILLIMGAIGYRFADTASPQPRTLEPSTEKDTFTSWRVATATCTIILIVSAASYYTIAQPDEAEGPVSVTWPETHRQWTMQTTEPAWRGQFHDADLESTTTYTHPEHGDISLFIGYLWAQTEDRELLSGRFEMDDQQQWSIQKQSGRHVKLENATLPFIETILQDEAGERIVWHTYWIGDTFVTSRLSGIFAQAQSQLFFGETRSAILAFSTHARDDRAYARDRLKQFLDSQYPYLQLLRNTSTSPKDMEAAQP